MRLDKFVCKSTNLSRAKAVEYIRAGKVVVNAVAVLLESVQVHENNIITLNAQLLKPREFRYLMLHKPVNTICSNVDEAYPSLFSALDIERSDELHVAGRLDADTTGLVLVTDDGRWSFDIIRPLKHCKKVYRVGLSQTIEAMQIIDLTAQFTAGLQLQGEGVLTRPAQLQILSPKEVLLTITEGKFHQVKRMFASIGKRVVSLHREKIGEVSLDVEVGAWRYLTAAEVDSFKGEP
ncbi:MAG: pseudouridine synthase [Gammaproteobacteria bacterium]|nr:pseudouridine synthase [Gammaproteobacteria bacterium]MBQ0839660.1 pseudouridine synthase [Gammaproteobacteria bacterium]